MWQRVHAHGLAKGSRDTKHCIVAEGRPLCHDTAQPRLRYGALRHGAGALRHAWQARDTARGARGRGLESRYKNCIVTRGEVSSVVTRSASARVGATTRQGVLETRPGQAYDTAQCARSVHAAWAMGGCIVHSTQF